jgi:Ca2+-binding RTX toxin-like protein
MLLSASITGMGVAGDSFSDEYSDARSGATYGYAENWVELLAQYRQVNFGPDESSSEPRLDGYRYNWARYGATTETLLTEGQHTGLAQQIEQGLVSHAMLEIGRNDFGLLPGGAYDNIYNGTWSAQQIASNVDTVVNNINTAIRTLTANNAQVVVATIPDPGVSGPIAAQYYPDANRRDLVSGTIAAVNARIRQLAQGYAIPVADFAGLTYSFLGTNQSPIASQILGGVMITNDAGVEPTHAFVHDGGHAHTVVQAGVANLFLEAFNEGYGTGVALFSEREMLEMAGLTYGGQDTLNIDFADFVVLPQDSGVSPGPEFQVNTFTSADPWAADRPRHVAMDADGDFVLAWDSWTSGVPTPGIYARRYDSAGEPEGDEFLVYTYTGPDSAQLFCEVAMDADGDFVVTWTSHEPMETGHQGVYARRYDAEGVPQGDEFRVNAATPYEALWSSVAMDADGDFVIAWNLIDEEGAVHAQRYNAAGEPQGDEFQVNSTATETWGFSEVAMDADGDFVVTWTRSSDGQATWEVMARQYDSDGLPQGDEFQVNPIASDAMPLPAVAMDSDGDFIISWTSVEESTTNPVVHARRYDAAGVSQGTEFRVNTTASGSLWGSSIATDTYGNFVITWATLAQGENGSGVYGQRYDAAGAAQGGEFRVDSATQDALIYPSAAMDADGDFIIAWFGGTRSGQDTLFDMFARRYEVINEPPEAEAGGPYSVLEGGSAALDASSSSDPDQPASTLTYQWDLDGDGTFGEIGAGAARGDEIGVSPTFRAGGLDGPTSIVVALRVTDNRGVENTESATIHVDNVAPSVAADAPTVTVDEGQTATNTGAWSDAGGDLVTLTTSVGTVTKNANGTWNWSFATTAGPEQSQTVTITATDDDGGKSETAFQLVVNPVVQLPAGTGTNNVVVSRKGDNLQVVNNKRQVLFDEPLSSFPKLTIRGAPGKSDAVTVDLPLGESPVLPDGIVFDAGKGKKADTLVLRGTAASDTFVLGDGSVMVNSMPVAIRDAEQVTLDGGSGDDTYRVSGFTTKTTIADSKGTDLVDFSQAAVGVTIDLSKSAGQSQKIFAPGNTNTLALKATIESVVGTPQADVIRGNSAANVILGGLGDDWLYGGAGNDFLFGGPGNNVLLGGAGDDVLDANNDVVVGSEGRNLLIGGAGLDTLLGGPGEDILIGGGTSYDAKATALAAVMREWASSSPFEARRGRLDAGLQDSTAGWIQLKRKGKTNRKGTVLDDALRDSLFGGADDDWLFNFVSDETHDP